MWTHRWHFSCGQVWRQSRSVDIKCGASSIVQQFLDTDVSLPNGLEILWCFGTLWCFVTIISVCRSSTSISVVCDSGLFSLSTSMWPGCDLWPFSSLSISTWLLLAIWRNFSAWWTCNTNKVWGGWLVDCCHCFWKKAYPIRERDAISHLVIFQFSINFFH